MWCVEMLMAKEQPPPKEKYKGLWKEVAFNLTICSQAKEPMLENRQTGKWGWGVQGSARSPRWLLSGRGMGKVRSGVECQGEGLLVSIRKGGCVKVQSPGTPPNCSVSGLGSTSSKQSSE